MLVDSFIVIIVDSSAHCYLQHQNDSKDKGEVIRYRDVVSIENPTEMKAALRKYENRL